MRVDQLWGLAVDLDEDEFQARYPAPALVLPPPSFETCHESGATTKRCPEERRVVETEATPSWYVHFLERIPRDPVNETITVGRASTNDVWVEDQTVSNAHASFQRDDGVWTVVDLGSRNGTFLDGRKLPDKVAVRLESGCRISLGTDVSGRFFEKSRDLQGYLRLQFLKLSRTVQA
jgi:hypothetical protein